MMKVNLEFDIKVFFYIMLILFLFDSIYFYVFGNYFKKVLEKVQKSKLKLKYLIMLCTYLLMAFTVYYFSVVKKFDLFDMFVLGLVIYGIYELTNYTTFENWSLNMVIIDSVWGGIIFSSTSYILKKLML